MLVAEKKRVLMLLENNPYTEDARVRNEASSLARAGYHVSVICPKPADGKPRAVADGVRVYEFLAPPEGNGFSGYLLEYAYAAVMMFVFSLIVWLREGIDIIHVHNPPDLLCCIAAFYKLFGKRFVFDHHDLAPELYSVRFPGPSSRLLLGMLMLCERVACRLADRIIASNQSYKAVEMERDRVLPERIEVVRNGPGLNALQPIEPDPDLRKRAGTILAYVGRMGPQDGVDYMLEAISILVHQLGKREILCIILGGGKMMPSLKVLTKELHIEEYVWFTGWISDQHILRRYLTTADICLDAVPSNSFNDRSTMIKLMEYMALAKPIVAFDLPEHRFTAESAVAYARPNDVSDFARQIAVLMDNPAQRRRMGQAGRDRVAKHLAWPYQEKRLLEVYGALSSDQALRQDASTRRMSL